MILLNKRFHHLSVTFLLNKSNGNPYTIYRGRVPTILQLIIRSVPNNLRLFPTPINRMRATSQHLSLFTNRTLI